MKTNERTADRVVANSQPQFSTRESVSERGAERERAQAREQPQPAFNSTLTLTVAAAVRKQEIADCPLQLHNNCGLLTFWLQIRLKISRSLQYQLIDQSEYCKSSKVNVNVIITYKCT